MLGHSAGLGLENLKSALEKQMIQSFAKLALADGVTNSNTYMGACAIQNDAAAKKKVCLESTSFLVDQRLDDAG